MNLGVIMHKSLKPSRQCVEAAKETDLTVCIMTRKIVNLTKTTIYWNCKYRCIARPQLKHYILQVVIARNQTWKNWKCEQELDVCKVSNYLYCEDKLKGCGLTILDRKRSRRDIILALKTIIGKKHYTAGEVLWMITKHDNYGARVADLQNGLDDSTV